MVRDGAGEMLGVLFDRYQTPLFNFYSKLTGDRAASEDLVQDVFLRILKYRRSYRPGTQFRPWLYQIARNARTDYASKRPPQSELDENAAPSSVTTTHEQDHQHELLRRALQDLPDDKREILLLSRFQGLRYEEMAQIYGCQLGAMKVRIHRALEDLREAFGRLEGGGAQVRSKTAGADHEL